MLGVFALAFPTLALSTAEPETGTCGECGVTWTNTAGECPICGRGSDE